MVIRRLVVPAAAFALGLTCASAPALASAQQPTPHSASFGASVKSPSAAFTTRTFSSPASNSVRSRRSLLHTVTPHTSGTGSTIYVTAATSCSPQTGDGSQANPYCDVQIAVNAAVSGDTVALTGNFTLTQSITVKTSGISIVGAGSTAATGIVGAWLKLELPSGQTAPLMVLNGVTGVTISNLATTSYYGSALDVVGSSNITVDSSSIEGQPMSQTDGSVEIDGASSNVAITRNVLSVMRTAAKDPDSAVSIAAGASKVTVAANAITQSTVHAFGANGLDIAGNTLQRGCDAAIDLEGASSAVFVENNELEDANPNYSWQSGPSQCAAYAQPYQPDVMVDSSAASATTSDYNDFSLQAGSGTQLYSWSGTGFTSLSGFQTQVGQGAHDTLDPVPPLGSPTNVVNMDLDPRLGSTMIGSANLSAPGRLASDMFGVSPYDTRGAIQFVNQDPNLAVGLSAVDNLAFNVILGVDVTGAANVNHTETIDWGDGTGSSASSTGSGTQNVTHPYARAGTYTVAVTVSDPQGQTATNTLRVMPAGSEFTAYGPTRFLDTRKGIGGVAAPLASGATRKLQVVGAGSAGAPIPSGVTAVVLNLTVTNTAAGGYVTAYPNEDPSGALMQRPTTSNVNFSRGQTVPNQAIVPVGADGAIDLYNGSGGNADLIADVTGYFTQQRASQYLPLSPTRLVDTRKGIGAPKAPLSAGQQITVQINGMAGVTLPDVTAVALNVTAVDEKAGGYFTLYPDGVTRPTASSVNFSPGQVIANSVTLPVGADGKIKVYNGSGGTADVIVDVVGYYTSASMGNGPTGSAYVPIAPTRVLDTRGSGPLPGGYFADLYAPISVDVPNLFSFVFDSVVTNTKSGGYESFTPDPNPPGAYSGGPYVLPNPPTTSTLNWGAGQTVANLVQVSVGPYGVFDIWNMSGGNIDLVIDEFGYFIHS